MIYAIDFHKNCIKNQWMISKFGNHPFFAVVVDKLKSVLFVHDVERAGVVEVGGYGDYRAVAMGVPIEVGVGGFGFVVFVFSRQNVERFPFRTCVVGIFFGPSAAACACASEAFHDTSFGEVHVEAYAVGQSALDDTSCDFGDVRHAGVEVGSRRVVGANGEPYAWDALQTTLDYGTHRA